MKSFETVSEYVGGSGSGLKESSNADLVYPVRIELYKEFEHTDLKTHLVSYIYAIQKIMIVQFYKPHFSS